VSGAVLQALSLVEYWAPQLTLLLCHVVSE
jgi:hypothetical protein